MDTSRTCTRCKAVKPATEFHRSQHRADGLSTRCRVCANEILKRWKRRDVDATVKRGGLLPREGHDHPAVFYLLWALNSKITVMSSGCWEWSGLRFSPGYGRLDLDGVQYRVHRLVYQYCVGDLPEELVVCHHCDNPPCCNPDHLFIGTKQDNLIDALTKGRGRQLLRKEDVIAIRQAASSGDISLQEVADRYGVSVDTIRNIIHRRTWKFLV